MAILQFIRQLQSGQADLHDLDVGSSCNCAISIVQGYASAPCYLTLAWAPEYVADRSRQSGRVDNITADQL